jgi:hypothetical protein
MSYRFVTTVRETFVSLIYSKTMNLSITALDESAAVTLVANDTGRYLPRQLPRRYIVAFNNLPKARINNMSRFASIHELWAVPIELGIAL